MHMHMHTCAYTIPCSFQRRGENRPGNMNNENGGTPWGHILIQLWFLQLHYESITFWIQTCWNSLWLNCRFMFKSNANALLIVKIVLCIRLDFHFPVWGIPVSSTRQIADSAALSWHSLLSLCCGELALVQKEAKETRRQTRYMAPTLDEQKFSWRNIL